MSNPETIPVVINLLWQLAPESVLDVGAGFGKYGVLFREYLERRHRQGDKSSPECMPTRENRLVRIDALDGFPHYVGDLHRIIYDNVYIVNILDFIKSQWAYDIIFMGDVLEHVEKPDAVNELLPALVERARMGVLISTPTRFKEQELEYGNELQLHRSQWKSHDFRGLAAFAYSGRKGGHLITFLTNEAQYYEIVRGNRLRRRLGVIRRSVLDSW